MKLENPQPTERWKPWLNLGLAIVEQACTDYMTAKYARLKFPKTDKGPTATELECIRFFEDEEHPAWFLKLDPKKIKEALDEIVQEAIESGHSPRLHDLQLNSPRYRRVNEQ